MIDTTTADGCLVASDHAEESGDTNRATELRQIAELRGAPERALLYVRHPAPYRSEGQFGGMAQQLSGWSIVTWPGTVVSQGPVIVGPSWRSGFAGSRRHSVSCTIFGTRYHGQFSIDAGDYIHLRKCRNQ